MKKLILCMALVAVLPAACLAKKTVVLIGDAGMAQHSIATPDLCGWGETLPYYFTKKVEILNFAQAGESTHILADGRLDLILKQFVVADFAMVQVGQNDLREEHGQMYYSTAEMGEHLLKIVDRLQEEKMKVILCTPLAHPYYLNGQVVNRLGGYPDVIRQVAKLKETYLIDLHELTTEWLNGMSEEDARLFYKYVSNDPQPIEHVLTEAGAKEVSRMVVNELIRQKIPYLHKQVLLTIVE